MNSSWTLCVSLRFSSAFPRVTLRHSAGGCLRCRLSESQRAKKSPQSLQKEILGCVSVLQCRLKSSHVLSVGLGVLGQRRHLISRTEPRAQSLAWLRAALLFLLLLLHRAADVVNQFLHTHPQPKSALRPLLLETRSQQGSMVNSLRVRGREPLRSASRFLGFVIDLWIWDPGHRLEADPGRGPCCPQDLFYLAAPDSCRSGPHAMRLTPAAFTKGQHRSGSEPLRWGFAGTSISDAGCTTTLHRRYSRRSAIKQCAVIRRYQSLFVIPAGKRRGCSGRGLPRLEEPTPVRLRSG